MSLCWTSPDVLLIFGRCVCFDSSKVSFSSHRFKGVGYQYDITVGVDLDYLTAIVFVGLARFF